MTAIEAYCRTCQRQVYMSPDDARLCPVCSTVLVMVGTESDPRGSEQQVRS